MTETFRDAFWRWHAAVTAHAIGSPHEGCGLVWDIETARLDPGSESLCVAWSEGGMAQAHPGNMLEATDFLTALRPGRLVVAHNMKYEVQALIARGIDPRQFVWLDTMLLEWVLVANNPRGLSLSLDATAQRRGLEAKDPEVDAMIKAGKVTEVPLDRLLARNVKDVEDTQAVLADQLQRMTEAQLRLGIIRCMYALELAHIELEGMGLDSARVYEECARNAAEIAEHEAALVGITRGANPKSVNEMSPVLFGLWPADVTEEDKASVMASGFQSLGFKPPPKWDSDKHLAGKAQARTKPTKNWPDGKPSIAKEIMAALAEKARTTAQKTWAAHYLALTEAIAERDKNLNFFRGLCDQAATASRVPVAYAELNQGRAATHRLTCSARSRVEVDGKEYGCQLQNIPRHLKGCFAPKRPGYLAASVDQSQAEFRGAVFLGDDEQGRADIDDPNFDAHIQTLTVMLHGPEDFAANYAALIARYKAGDKEVKWQRADNRLCKGHTFKPLFGGSSGTDRERAYYKWFGKRYAGVTATQNAWDQEVQQTGRYLAPTGMQFHWDRSWQANQWGRQSMVNHAGRSLYSIVRNLPIQYFATGELAMVSTLNLLYECRRWEVRYFPVMLTHDDTSGECHPHDVPAWRKACAEAYGPMTWAFMLEAYGVDYDVELAAESKAGVRFGEGVTQEHAYKAPDINEERFMKIAANAGGGDRTPKVKAGTHIALVNAVVDLGVQPGSVAYPNPKRKIYFGFEFPNIMLEFKKDDGTVETAPARLGRFMAASMHEKATLRKVVASLRGTPFKSDAEAYNFDVFTLLGKACMVPVIHKVVGTDIYANVGDPAPVLEGMVVTATLAEKPLRYDTDAPDAADFSALPEWLRKIIEGQVKPGQAPPPPSKDTPAITGGLKDLGQE